MTPPEVAEHFEREYGCTTTEWLRWLPGAVRDCPWRFDASTAATITLPTGSLVLHWQVLEPRRIALISMPRLRVLFAFNNTSPEERQTFLRYFDLYMQRGGG